MRRMLPALVLGLILAPIALTATPPKAGTYEVVSVAPTGETIMCLVKITPKGDSVEAEFVASHPTFRATGVKSVTLDGDILLLSIKGGPAGDSTFEARIPTAGADNLRGSFESGGRMTAGRMTLTTKTELTAATATVRATLPEPMQKVQALSTKVAQLRQRAAQAKAEDEKAKLTKEVTDADKEAQAEAPKLYREVIEKHPDNLSVMTAAQSLIRQAGKENTDALQVRGWAAALLKLAQSYGPRYENDITAQIAEWLVPQSAYGDLALEYAQRAEKQLTATDTFDRQVRVLNVLTTAQKKAGQTADAEKTTARVGKLEFNNAVKAEKALTDSDSAEKRASVLGLLAAAQRKAAMLADAERTTARVAKLELEHAQQADKALTDSTLPEKRASVLTVLAAAQRKAGMAADADKTEAHLAKLDADLDREYQAKVPPFKPTEFAGRKAQSDRAAVMELFTGAQCPPCVAADVAFDVLEKTYKHGEVVLIQYHLHIPGPDPMTNGTTEARAKYYDVSSTPSTFFNGQRDASGGGGMPAAENKYNEYRGILDKLLEQPAGAAVKLDAKRLGDSINVRADVANVADPGDGKRLRFVLVEETVRFTGVNKLRLHHMVVRAMPGGPDGVPLLKKEGLYTASVNLGDLRQELTDYLHTYAATKRPFPQPERPMAFKNLKAIALVQDEKTKEILQAVIVDVGGERAAP